MPEVKPWALDVKIGDPVTYVDPTGVERPALVICVFGQCDAAGRLLHAPSINVVYVSPDQSREDSYGRQFERATSVVYCTNQPAHGNFWRFASGDENQDPACAAQAK